MRTRKIILSSDEVTKFPTRGGGIDKLLEIETPRGTSYVYPNPSPVISKLYDTGGNEIPYDTEFLVFKRRNGEDFGTFLNSFTYESYFGLSEGDQRNVKYAHQITQQLGPVDKAGVRNPQEHTLEVWVNSSVQINLNDARSRFEISVIEQN